MPVEKVLTVSEKFNNADVAEVARISSAVGMKIPTGTPWEKWNRYGAVLGFENRGQRWRLGDWLCFGESKYGEKYEDAMRLTGYSYKTCMNAKYVCSRIEMSRRRENVKVTFEHHAAVASLPPDVQDELLSLCEEKGFSLVQFRTAIRQRRDGAEGTPTGTGEDSSGTQTTMGTTPTPRVPLTPDAIEKSEVARRTRVHLLVKRSQEVATRYIAMAQLEAAEAGKHADKVEVALRELVNVGMELLEVFSHMHADAPRVVKTKEAKAA